MPAIQVIVGEVNGADSSDPVTARGGRQRDVIVSELHGRYYEQNFRRRLFSGGMSITSISNATFTTATLGPTCTPIIGIWNPMGSGYNLSVLQTILSVVITALQNTGGAPYIWATSTGNAAISTGNAMFNRKDFGASAASGGKDLSGVALTGLTNNLVVRSAAGLGGGNIHNFASLDTAASYPTQHTSPVDLIDGAWFVPPGGILALLATTTPVAHSAGSGFLVEEVPV